VKAICTLDSFARHVKGQEQYPVKKGFVVAVGKGVPNHKNEKCVGFAK
jgi:hypothetical protein